MGAPKRAKAEVALVEATRFNEKLTTVVGSPDKVKVSTHHVAWTEEETKNKMKKKRIYSGEEIIVYSPHP